MADTKKNFFLLATTISHFFANDFSVTTNIRYPPTSRIESEDYFYSIHRTPVTSMTHALLEGVAHDKQRRRPQFIMSMKPVTLPARQAIPHHSTRNIRTLDGGSPRVNSRHRRVCVRSRRLAADRRDGTIGPLRSAHTHGARQWLGSLHVTSRFTAAHTNLHRFPS
jgi:hypothetical protein